MSCYYQQEPPRSMTCEWSQSDSLTESDASLIFKKDQIISCWGIFSVSAFLNVTVRMKNYLMGREIWSHPHSGFLSDIAKPRQLVLTVRGSTEDSVSVSWTTRSDGSCRLRYRVDNHTWTQASDSIPALRQQMLVHTIKDLQPFTVYTFSVACRMEFGIWSDWSSDVTARTLERAPSRPPEVCYRVEKTDSGKATLLHLMWKDLDRHEAGGRILGYQVSYEQVKTPPVQNRRIQNMTGVTAPLVVDDGNYSVTVTAFNEAGYGPAAHLSIDTRRQRTVPSVRNLWVFTSFPAVKDLRVQWEVPERPVSHFTVQWFPETRPSNRRWSRVSASNTSTVIKDVDPDESYMISVFPVYEQQCGAPQSLPASLQQGALMEAVRLEVMDVTKTTVTAGWAWQRKRKSGRIRVNRYILTLKRDAETQTLLISADRSQHTFLQLEPNTEYSLQLSSDDVSRDIIHFRTNFNEVPVVATVTPLLLLAVAAFIISILSRTVYKSYFFPPISSPRGSTTGQWLMDPHLQKTADRNILDIEDFQVKDVLGEKSLIIIGPKSSSTTEEEEDYDEDKPALSLSHLIIELDLNYVTNTEPPPLQPPPPPVSLLSLHPDYAVNCRDPDAASTPEQSGEVDRQTRRVNGCFPQKEEESRPVCHVSHPEGTAVNAHFHELMRANADSCFYQMTCEDEYVVNCSFLGKAAADDVETESGLLPDV
ncbi:interleukin-6 receptor subunit beta [Scomber scombrus]|uniref:Interleukin-6 receptor subunit beta n=1 Tax=Scomber scombrus TaxID=13677 RepID=A0AAV1PZ23_SCOSC